MRSIDRLNADPYLLSMLTARRLLLALPLAALMTVGCSDSTDPVEVVPRQLYYIAWNSGAYPYISGDLKLYGLALDGSSPVPILPDSVRAKVKLNENFPPWISRDGQQIKLISGYTDSTASIITVDQFGGLLSIVPFPDSVPFSPRPTFSPDGTRLAWYTRGFLKIAAVDGSGIQKINFDSLGSSSGEVAWSSDGGSVAFVTWHALQIDPNTPTDVRLWTRRLADGFTRPVATLVDAAGAPAWSRDGKWLTVTVEGSVHRLRADGSGTEQVLYDGGLAGARMSAWGSGDSLVAIVAGNRLLLIHPDGGGARAMPQTGYLSSVAWRD